MWRRILRCSRSSCSSDRPARSRWAFLTRWRSREPPQQANKDFQRTRRSYIHKTSAGACQASWTFLAFFTGYPFALLSRRLATMLNRWTGRGGSKLTRPRQISLRNSGACLRTQLLCEFVVILQNLDQEIQHAEVHRQLCVHFLHAVCLFGQRDIEAHCV